MSPGCHRASIPRAAYATVRRMNAAEVLLLGQVRRWVTDGTAVALRKMAGKALRVER